MPSSHPNQPARAALALRPDGIELAPADATRVPAELRESLQLTPQCALLPWSAILHSFNKFNNHPLFRDIPIETPFILHLMAQGSFVRPQAFTFGARFFYLAEAAVERLAANHPREARREAPPAARETASIPPERRADPAAPPRHSRVIDLRRLGPLFLDPSGRPCARMTPAQWTALGLVDAPARRPTEASLRRTALALQTLARTHPSEITLDSLLSREALREIDRVTVALLPHPDGQRFIPRPAVAGLATGDLERYLAQRNRGFLRIPTSCHASETLFFSARAERALDAILTCPPLTLDELTGAPAVHLGPDVDLSAWQPPAGATTPGAVM